MSPLERIALSPKEAAEAIGVSERWLRTQMRSGGLPYSRVEGRILILPGKLVSWLERHEEREKKLDEGLEEEVERALKLVDGSLGRVQAP